jgi:hypothetical protein
MKIKNSVYNKVFDFIRTDLMCQVFPEVIYNTKNSGISLAFGGSSIVFIKEIPMMRTYHVHARIISWSPGGKWIYVQGIFTLPASKKSNTMTKKQQFALINDVNADPGMASGTSTPTAYIPSSTTTMAGETICAVVYGRYVFKRKRRETVPVPDVLRICGYTGYDDEIERQRAEGWEYVKGLELDWNRDRALHSARDI